VPSGVSAVAVLEGSTLKGTPIGGKTTFVPPAWIADALAVVLSKASVVVVAEGMTTGISDSPCDAWSADALAMLACAEFITAAAETDRSLNAAARTRT